MRRSMRKLVAVFGVVLVVAVAAASTSLADKPGNSLNAKLCQKNGWMGLLTRSGEPFSGEEACTSYGAHGGQLIVTAARACLDDGWKTLGQTAGQPFDSEQACVDFVNGGGTPVAAGTADLAVAAAVSSSAPNVGDTVTFTVTVNDLGPDPATGVELSDALPAGLAFVSAIPSHGSYSSSSGVWTVGTVTTTTAETLQLQAQVVSPDGQTNTATIAHSDQFDPVTANNSASVTTTPTAPPPPGPGPIKVSANGRYLVDEHGNPFLMTGESPQATIGQLTEADAAVFFAKRKSQGFNIVWINLLCNWYTGCNADGTTWDGVQPFTTPGDLSTPNEAYFAHVDRVLQLAQQNGLIVLLDPIETGGWLGTLVSNGVTKDRDFGRYLGARYKNFPNIIWMSGNDYQQWGPTNDPYVMAVAQGIADNDPNHLQTVELNFFNSGSLDDPAWAPLIQLDAAYTYDPTYKQVLIEYNRPSPLPTFMVEATYEFEQNNPSIPFGSPLQLRKQEYWSLLSGATGQLYGNKYTWQFLCPHATGPGTARRATAAGRISWTRPARTTWRTSPGSSPRGTGGSSSRTSGIRS